MFLKLKTIGCVVSLAATVTLLAACGDSGEATGNESAADIIETGAATGADTITTPAGPATGATTAVEPAPDNTVVSQPLVTPPVETPVETPEPEPAAPVLTPIDTSASAIVANATKSGSSSGDADTEFDFPEITLAGGGLSITIPDGALPEFAARRTLINGTGQSIEFGDAVVLKYDMFSWTNGELVESSTQLEGPYAVSAGVSDNIPEYLAKSLLGRRLGETMQIVFPVGMEDLPEYMNPADAYVLVVELL